MKGENKPAKQKDEKISRRNFMRGAAAAFTIVPRYVLGGPGHTAPSEMLNVAIIGAGGMGTVNTKALLVGALSEDEMRERNAQIEDDLHEHSGVRVVAVCDVDANNRDRVRDMVNEKYGNKDCVTYNDFREMLTSEDIDAVVVATPDNTHAVATMAAIRMGKHVYCEKPLTHDVFEARKITQAAQEAKVATQMGNQGQASEKTRLICEFILDGAIGPVHEVRAWCDAKISPRGIDRPKETPPVPSTLDWDLWLGPAPYRPYHPCYHPFSWRGWWDFGTGVLGDIGCHVFHPIFKALKLGHPTSVEASSSGVNSETVPLASIVRYKFPARSEMPPVTLTWYDGGLMPARPEELEEGRNLSGGALYIGDKGKMMGHRLIPESKMKSYKRPPKTLPRSVGHYKEWIEACKGGKPAGSNFDFAGLVTEVVLLGNIALRTGKKVQWDAKEMKVANIPEANKYIQRQYRQGWIL